MLVKKSGGKVFGASLTATEKKAMEMEINRQIAESDRKHMNEIDALVLWQLKEQLGFGQKRLRRFYDGFAPALLELIEHYEMPDAPAWLCMEMLKQIGVDVEAWSRERREINDLHNE